MPTFDPYAILPYLKRAGTLLQGVSVAAPDNNFGSTYQASPGQSLGPQFPRPGNPQFARPANPSFGPVSNPRFAPPFGSPTPPLAPQMAGNEDEGLNMAARPALAGAFNPPANPPMPPPRPQMSPADPWAGIRNAPGSPMNILPPGAQAQKPAYSAYADFDNETDPRRQGLDMARPQATPLPDLLQKYMQMFQARS